ncbi:lectin-like domain-containing protein, partial [Apilactobacillus micheneri]
FTFSFSNFVKADSKSITIDAKNGKKINDAFDVSSVENDGNGNTVVLTHQGQQGEVRGAATLKNKIDFSKGFEISGKINIGCINNPLSWSKLGDGISFGFSDDNTKSIGRAGGGLGVSGLNGAFGWKIDTYYNNVGDNKEEIKNKQFYDADPSVTIDETNDGESSILYQKNQPYGGFVTNDYNNGINTTRTYNATSNGPEPTVKRGSNDYLSAPKKLYQLSGIPYTDNWINININYDGTSMSVKLGNGKDPQWKINVSELTNSSLNKQPKSFFIAGSNGVSTGTQKFKFDKITYTPYPTIDLNFKDSNGNYIYNNRVNNNNSGTGDNINDSIKYSVPVIYNYNDKIYSYKFDLPSIKGYSFNTITSDNPNTIPKSSDAFHYKGNVYENINNGNDNNGNVNVLYNPNKVIFNYVDEKGNPLKDNSGKEQSDGLTNAKVDNNDGKIYYPNFKYNYYDELQHKISNYVLDDQKNNLDIDFGNNNDFKDGVKKVNVYYKKINQDQGSQSDKDKDKDQGSQSDKDKDKDQGSQSDKDKDKDQGSQSDKDKDKDQGSQSDKDKDKDQGSQSDKDKDKDQGSQADKNYDKHGLIRNKTIVYPIKSMNLYRNNYFNKKNLIRHYTNKPMINKPIFVVDGHDKSSTGLLRYKIHEMNHKNRIGYITVRKDYVLPVYETKVPKYVTVINPGGANSYKKKNLTRMVKHYRQGNVLRVKGIVWNKRSTRYVLNDGKFITANKTLTSSGFHRMYKSFLAKKGLSVYADVQLNKQLSKIHKDKIISIKNWEYSDKENTSKHGGLRYRISGGYVFAHSKHLKLIK